MFILLLIPYAICIQSNLINIGKSYEGQINTKYDNSLGRSYYFEISELKNNADIIIIVSQKTPEGDPNIFLSLLNPEPYSIEESELGYCQSQGSDLCVIDKTLIQKDQPYYIGITCSEDCKYTLKVNYDLEQIMLMNDLLRFKMREGTSSQVVKIQLDNNLNIEELEITGRIRNYFEIENAFHMYLNVGDTLPSSQKQDYIGKDLQHGYKHLIIPWINIKNAEILTIIIESQIGSLIDLQTQTYERIRKNVQNSIISGEVLLNQTHHYQIERSYLVDSQNLFQIQMKPYSGQITVFINFQEPLPTILENYAYQYKINQSSNIIFSNVDLDKYGKTQYFDLIIQGNQYSSYEFKVCSSDHIELIHQDLNYKGRVHKDQIIQYEINVRSDSIGGKLHLQIESENNNVVIIIKQSNHMRQKISKDDILNMNNYESHDSKNLFIFTKKNQQNLSFELNFPIISQNLRVGIYSVGVFLNESYTDFSSYSFIFRSEQKFKSLKNNTPYKGFINKESYQYYQYVLIPKQNIKQVQIMLTSIQGMTNLYSSTIDFPTISNYEQKGENNMITYNFTETINTQEIYFLSVYCTTDSFYTITVIIINDNNQVNLGIYPWEYTQIFKGDSQFHVLNSNNDQSFELFKIDLAEQIQFQQIKNTVQNKRKKLISIHLLSPLGGIMMYGFLSPSPNIHHPKWKNSKEIYIFLDELDGEQTIYLRIELQENYNYSTYKIGIHSRNLEIQEILENQHYFGFIEQSESQILSFIYNQDLDYTITKHQEGQGKNLRVSALLKNDTLSTFESTLLLSKQKLEDQNCNIYTKKQEYCFILIQITSIKSTFFTLMISHENNQIQLHMDQIIHQKLPKEVDHYYSQIDERDSIIMVKNLYENIQLQILVTLFQIESNEINFENQYPQNDRSSNLFKVSKNFKGFSTSSVSIYKDELKQGFNCSNKCMIAITIRKVPGFNYTINQNSIYQIIYSSGSRRLSIKSLLPGKISKGYTAFYNIQIKDEDVELIIQLEQSNNCDINMIISKDDFPNQEKYDWFYRNLDQKYYSITPSNNIYQSMIGVYQLGVFGNEECHYYITYYLQNFTQQLPQIQYQEDPYLLIQNQQKIVTSVNPINWKFQCEKQGRLVVQLQYLSQNVAIQGNSSSEFVILFQNNFQLIGYFPIEKVDTYYFQTQIIQNIENQDLEIKYQIRATLISKDSILPQYPSQSRNLIQEVIIGKETIILANPLKLDLLNTSFQVEQIKYSLLTENSQVNNNSIYFNQVNDTRALQTSSKRQFNQNISLQCQSLCENNTVYSVHAIATVTLYNLERIDLDYFYDQFQVDSNFSMKQYYYEIGFIVLVILIILIIILIIKKLKKRSQFSLVKNVEQHTIEMIYKNI